MDTPATESSALDASQAAALFADILEPAQAEEPKKEEAKPLAEALKEPEDKPEEAEKVEAEPEQTDETITIQVDGKDVEVKKSELADYYKNGLRQADYTKKTMQTAEERKALETEKLAAQQERQKHAIGLQQAEAVVRSQLQEYANVDWEALLQANQQEYWRHKGIVAERQAKLTQILQGREQVNQAERAEAKKALLEHLSKEHQAVLDKVPEWKDEKKAQAEQAEIVKELLERGFELERIVGEKDKDGTAKLENPGLTDHRILLMARDAMKYRQLLSKASAATKKVENLPKKVERPSGGENTALDGRTSAMKRFDKTGSIDDAARVFANLL